MSGRKGRRCEPDDEAQEDSGAAHGAQLGHAAWFRPLRVGTAPGATAGAVGCAGWAACRFERSPLSVRAGVCEQCRASRGLKGQTRDATSSIAVDSLLAPVPQPKAAGMQPPTVPPATCLVCIGLHTLLWLCWKDQEGMGGSLQGRVALSTGAHSHAYCCAPVHRYVMPY